MVFIVLCIVAIVLLSVVRMNVSGNKSEETAEFEFNKGTDDIDTNKKHWEYICGTIEKNLESYKAIKEVSVQPAAYDDYLPNKEIVINVSLQEGKTLDDELQKSIETYVYTVIDCEKVTVVEEKEELIGNCETHFLKACVVQM